MQRIFSLTDPTFDTSLNGQTSCSNTRGFIPSNLPCFLNKRRRFCLISKLYTKLEVARNPGRGGDADPRKALCDRQRQPRRRPPSGCSIDNLRRTIETILTRNGIEWLEAGYIFYRQPDGDIVPVHFRDIQSLIHAGQIGADTIVFDHSLDQSDDLGRWEVPMSQTWLRRYLVSPAAV